VVVASEVGEGIVGGDLRQQLAVRSLVHHEPRRRLLPALRALAFGTFKRQL
jgi:hypothetical protein